MNLSLLIFNGSNFMNSTLICNYVQRKFSFFIDCKKHRHVCLGERRHICRSGSSMSLVEESETKEMQYVKWLLSSIMVACINFVAISKRKLKALILNYSCSACKISTLRSISVSIYNWLNSISPRFPPCMWPPFFMTLVENSYRTWHLMISWFYWLVKLLHSALK